MQIRSIRRQHLVLAAVLCLGAVVLGTVWYSYRRDRSTRFRGYVHEYSRDPTHKGHPYGTNTLTRVEIDAILKEYDSRIADDPGDGALISEKIHFAMDYDPELAVRACRELLAYSPDSEYLMSHLAIAYMQCGAHDKALRYAMKCVDARANVDNLLVLGQVYYRTRALERAGEVYRQVLSMEPDNEHAKKALEYIDDLRSHRSQR